MPGFRQIMETDKDVTSFDEAPMIRGIISRINGMPAKEYAGIIGFLEVTAASLTQANHLNEVKSLKVFGGSRAMRAQLK